MTRILFDTNVAIDLVIARVPKTHESILQLLGLCGNDDVLMLSTLSLKDLSFYLENNRQIREVIPSKRDRARMAHEARGCILGQFAICAIDEAIVRAAHDNTAEPDFDDALVAECAKAYRADVIVSSDKEAFIDSAVPKMTPAECVRFLKVRNRSEPKRG